MKVTAIEDVEVYSDSLWDDPPTSSNVVLSILPKDEVVLPLGETRDVPCLGRYDKVLAKGFSGWIFSLALKDA